MLLFLLQTAIAAPPSYNLPSADRSDPGWTLSAGPGLAASDPATLPAARLGLDWQGEDWSMRSSSTLYWASEWTERFDVLGASYQVLDREQVQLAPWIMLAQFKGESPLDHRLTGRLGLALDTGGERLRYDLSLGLLGGAWYPGEGVETPWVMLNVFESLVTMEMGARWDFQQGHMIRAGLLGPLASLRYGWTGEQLGVTLTAATGQRRLLQSEWRLSW